MSFNRKLRRCQIPTSGAYIRRILHDADCQQVLTGECSCCCPDYVIEPMTASSLARAVKASRDWQRERLS